MNNKELEGFLKYQNPQQHQLKSQVKQTYEIKNLLKVLNSSKKCLESLKTQLAVTTTMFMISTRSRFINMTYQLSSLIRELSINYPS